MISIVTGTLDRLELLKLVINNTVDKSDKLELVLVDGGSTDGTIDYVKGLNNDRIKLIEVGERSPYPSFMNLGIKSSTYEWIVQWNDDVLLINDWKDVIELLEKGNSDAYIFDWNRGTLDNFNNNRFSSDWISFSHCMNFGAYKKNIFREIGMYDSKFKYYECDHDMTMRCLQFGYKVNNAHHIKVFEIRAEKKCIQYDDDLNKFFENRYYYNQQTLPSTIEKLI
jgi:glycosyltransferase involved in cell wall biosynthesis